jgi:hypothetical protein
MQRRVVQRILLRTFAIALLLQSVVYGQSLGEVARENRDKQSGEETPAATKSRVITNKDLPKDPNENQAPTQAPGAASAAATSKNADPFSAKGPSADQRLAEQRKSQQRLAEQRLADQKSAQQRLAQQRAADRWKRQILAQKIKMASLQARIDQLHASIRSAGGSIQSEGPYTRSQAQQLQGVAQVQQQLDEQKWKLEQMQEAARHAGLHTAVYDP